jgi:hypothetical protein
MKKKLLWPQRDANGKVIEPVSLTTPIFEFMRLRECSRCHRMRQQIIVKGMCDPCALEYGRNVRETIKAKQ